MHETHVIERRSQLAPVLALLLFAVASVAAVGAMDAPISAAKHCQGSVFDDIGTAKTSFRDECDRPWNDQVRDQCSWVEQLAAGWICHTYAPNGPANPQSPPAASSFSGFASPRSRSINGNDALSYWTRERMDNAKDVLSGASASTPNAAPESLSDIPVPAIFESTTGRVFFTVPGFGDASCTGSVVNSPGKNTVWTAGRCVHLNGGWATNWMFVPGYDNGREPYGRWTAKQLWSPQGWVKGGNVTTSCGTKFESGQLRYDIGVAVLHPKNGKEVANVVGGNGLLFYPSVGASATAYSYGRGSGGGCDESPVGTRDIVGCSGALGSSGRKGVFAVPCPKFGPGSSGGGIFTTYNRSPRYLYGVISHFDPRRPDVMYSPYFGEAAVNLNNATKNL